MDERENNSNLNFRQNKYSRSISHRKPCAFNETCRHTQAPMDHRKIFFRVTISSLYIRQAYNETKPLIINLKSCRQKLVIKKAKSVMQTRSGHLKNFYSSALTLNCHGVIGKQTVDINV